VLTNSQYHSIINIQSERDNFMNAFRVTATDLDTIVADYIFSSMAEAIEFVRGMVNKVDKVKIERISV